MKYACATVFLTVCFLLNIYAHANSVCVSTIQELKYAPRIKSIVDSMGGIEQLQGVWHFGGILGVGKTSVVFQSRPSEGNSFVAKLDDSTFSKVLICEARQPGTLQIVVIKPSTSRMPSSEDSVIYLRKGDDGKIQLAGEKSKGKYYSFHKLSSAPPVEAMYASTSSPTRGLK